MSDKDTVQAIYNQMFSIKPPNNNIPLDINAPHLITLDMQTRYKQLMADPFVFKQGKRAKTCGGGKRARVEKGKLKVE